MNGNMLGFCGTLLWRRFALRACAIAGILTAGTCLLMANWILDGQQERKSADEIERLGGRMYYAWRLDEKIQVASAKSDRAPGWLVPGDAFAAGVFLPFCHEESFDQKLACLKRLRNLRWLDLSNAGITDAALVHVAGLATGSAWRPAIT